MMTLSKTWPIKHFSFKDLLKAQNLLKLDAEFLQFLSQKNPNLYQNLLAYRDETKPFSAIELSEFLINSAVILEEFLINLFEIQEAYAISQIVTTSQNPISIFKKYYVLRRAKKDLLKAEKLESEEELNRWLQLALSQTSLKTDDQELALALLGNQYLNDPTTFAVEIEKLVSWCVRALINENSLPLREKWSSFKIPARLDYLNLVPTLSVKKNQCENHIAKPSELRLRDGFKLTDPRMNVREVQDEVNYCIYCHDHDGDFCSKGFPVKKGEPAQGFKKNPLDIILTGCPLEEKISEMQFLKRDGHTLASLAMVMVDNPMCPATGHRICNDCMKSCIYQKQEPVNIPQIETRVLTDVLALPWGVEIYDLLTRWNPLRKTQWVMKPYNGLKIMIAGMGPAGFTLAHHLLLEGFAVLGFDGLKIEPLPEALYTQPIYQFADLKESLDERLMAGFGGVAEYGITVRWDKNFLKLIYLSLMRKPHFQVFGGVRFGGTITVEDAWEMGFDHFVVAVGAGLPKALSIPGSLAPGMRQANDFLMALQLGNAAKISSLTNLQVRLPAVVIGGGLTGVDTATELQAYYMTQVEKIVERYEILMAEKGQDFIWNQLDKNSRNIFQEFLTHGKAVKAERLAAQNENRKPDFIKLARNWGGVSIVYRRTMQESPAYVNNHEELHKALQEGIYYIESLEPKEALLDETGHVNALVCYRREKDSDNEWITTKEEVTLSARSILVATGTQPNTAYEFEHKGTFNRLNFQYQHYEAKPDLTVAHGVLHCKDNEFGPFTSYQKHQKYVSLIGDTHPVFHGNVVKAIASGARTYPKILEILKDKLGHLGDENEYQTFATRMQYLFASKIKSITRRAPHILELIIHAPLAAKHYKAGQFYRLQNFETFSPCIDHTLLQMEPIALPVADCNTVNGSLTFWINEYNVATKLCATLKPDMPITLMGPTGARAKIPTTHETILIIGNQSSFSSVHSYGKALRVAGNHVIFVCFLNSKDEVYCQTELEQATDIILWATKDASIISKTRDSDVSITTDNIILALTQYAEAISLVNVDRIFLMGTTDLLKQFQEARKTLLKDFLVKDPKVIGSVYGNMQCMLKGVCAQCLQWQIDPETGLRTKAVFACSWQDQPLEIIDIDHMDERKIQNQPLEHLNNLWVDHIFLSHTQLNSI